MCGCSSQNFMDVSISNPVVYNVGPSNLPSPEMFGTDSINPLGANESEMNEMEDEDEGSDEDID
jgi:hypothetical protein